MGRQRPIFLSFSRRQLTRYHNDHQPNISIRTKGATTIPMMPSSVTTLMSDQRRIAVRSVIRGNLPKCSDVKKPAEAASSILRGVAFSKVYENSDSIFLIPLGFAHRCAEKLCFSVSLLHSPRLRRPPVYFAVICGKRLIFQWIPSLRAARLSGNSIGIIVPTTTAPNITPQIAPSKIFGIV